MGDDEFCRSHRLSPAPHGGLSPAALLGESPLGVYAGALTPEERRLFEQRRDAGDVEPEIWLLRVMSRRLFVALGQGDADQETVRKLAGVLYQGIARLAQLLRTRRALSGEAVDGLAGALAQALDELDTIEGGNA